MRWAAAGLVSVSGERSITVLRGPSPSIEYPYPIFTGALVRRSYRRSGPTRSAATAFAPSRSSLQHSAGAGPIRPNASPSHLVMIPFQLILCDALTSGKRPREGGLLAKKSHECNPAAEAWLALEEWRAYHASLFLLIHAPHAACRFGCAADCGLEPVWPVLLSVRAAFAVPGLSYADAIAAATRCLPTYQPRSQIDCS